MNKWPVGREHTADLFIDIYADATIIVYYRKYLVYTKVKIRYWNGCQLK